MTYIKYKNCGIFFRFIKDVDCGEFHVNPVLTVTWNNDVEDLIGFGAALEWGVWALYIAFGKTN